MPGIKSNAPIPAEAKFKPAVLLPDHLIDRLSGIGLLRERPCCCSRNQRSKHGAIVVCIPVRHVGAEQLSRSKLYFDHISFAHATKRLGSGHRRAVPAQIAVISFFYSGRLP
jgi:hypothetical protein